MQAQTEASEKPLPEDETRASDQSSAVEAITPPATYSPATEAVQSSIQQALQAGLLDSRRNPLYLQAMTLWAGDIVSQTTALHRRAEVQDKQNRDLNERLTEARETIAGLTAAEGTRKHHRPMLVMNSILGPTLAVSGISVLPATAGWILIAAGILMIGYSLYTEYGAASPQRPPERPG